MPPLIGPTNNELPLPELETVEWRSFHLRYPRGHPPAPAECTLAAWALHIHPDATGFADPGVFEMLRTLDPPDRPVIFLPNGTGELLPAIRAPYDDLPETAPFPPDPPDRHSATVLFVFRHQCIGGDHRYHVTLMQALRRRGYRIVAVALRDGNQEFEEEIRAAADWVYVPARVLPLDWFPSFLAWLLGHHRVETVISTDSPLFLRMIPYLRARHPAVVFVDVAHLVEESISSGGHVRWTLMYESQLDLIITESQMVCDWLVAHGVAGEKCLSLGPLLDTGWWSPDAVDCAAQRQRHGLAESDVHLVYHGRLDRVKRPQLLLTLFQLLHDRLPFVRLGIAGSGPEEAYLKAQVARAGLAGVVQFHGPLNAVAVRNLLASADITVLPSVNEGLSLAVVESMAMGLAVVAADVGAHRELVTPACGLLIPRCERETEAYLEALSQCAREEAFRKALGRQARARILACCDAEQAAARLLTLLAQFRAHPQRPAPLPLSLAKAIASDGIERLRVRKDHYATPARPQAALHRLIQRKLQSKRTGRNV